MLLGGCDFGRAQGDHPLARAGGQRCSAPSWGGFGGMEMSRERPTIWDLRANKGKRQYTMVRLFTLEEAEAAERAGIDMVSVPPELLLNPQYRDAAPTLFTMPGENFYEFGTADDFVRFAFNLYKHGADAVYSSAGFATVKRLADDNIPVIGHVGLIPSRKTWTGGLRRSARRRKPPCRSFFLLAARRERSA
jgi:ketopantoate hydroxymethyltransferase